MEEQTAGYIVDGFAFDTDEKAEIAAKESQGVAFIRGKTDFDNIELVLQVYHKILDQNMFKTSVGLRFLFELQSLLIENPFINDEDIKPIDVEQILKLEPKKEENPNSNKKKPKKVSNKKIESENKTKNKLQISLIVNAGLVIAIVAMFVITLTSKNNNFIKNNSEQVNQLASWEQELTEREQQIREKEKELNINNE